MREGWREEREAESWEERGEDQGEEGGGHLGGVEGFTRLVYTNCGQMASEDEWMGERVGEEKANSGPLVRSIAQSEERRPRIAEVVGSNPNRSTNSLAELPTRVYRLDPVTGDAAVVADDLVKPNGLCFSPDESRLYISDTGNSHDPDGPGHIRVFEVVEGGRCMVARFSPICPPDSPMAYGLIATAICGPASAGPDQERTACTA